jgi:hypothetical protein
MLDLMLIAYKDRYWFKAVVVLENCSLIVRLRIVMPSTNTVALNPIVAFRIVVISVNVATVWCSSSDGRAHQFDWYEIKRVTAVHGVAFV